MQATCSSQYERRARSECLLRTCNGMDGAPGGLDSRVNAVPPSAVSRMLSPPMHSTLRPHRGCSRQHQQRWWRLHGMRNKRDYLCWRPPLSPPATGDTEPTTHVCHDVDDRRPGIQADVGRRRPVLLRGPCQPQSTRFRGDHSGHVLDLHPSNREQRPGSRGQWQGCRAQWQSMPAAAAAAAAGADITRGCPHLRRVPDGGVIDWVREGGGAVYRAGCRVLDAGALDAVRGVEAPVPLGDAQVADLQSAAGTGGVAAGPVVRVAAGRCEAPLLLLTFDSGEYHCPGSPWRAVICGGMSSRRMPAHP